MQTKFNLGDKIPNMLMMVSMKMVCPDCNGEWKRVIDGCKYVCSNCNPDMGYVTRSVRRPVVLTIKEIYSSLTSPLPRYTLAFEASGGYAGSFYEDELIEHMKNQAKEFNNVDSQ